MGCCGEACRASFALRTSRAVASLGQVYERHADDYTRAAEQTDDPVFRNMLLALALQWRQAAQEEAAKQSTEPKSATTRLEMTTGPVDCVSSPQSAKHD
jgi:hypothetical protein